MLGCYRPSSCGLVGLGGYLYITCCSNQEFFRASIGFTRSPSWAYIIDWITTESITTHHPRGEAGRPVSCLGTQNCTATSACVRPNILPECFTKCPIRDCCAALLKSLVPFSVSGSGINHHLTNVAIFAARGTKASPSCAAAIATQPYKCYAQHLSARIAGHSQRIRHTHVHRSNGSTVPGRLRSPQLHRRGTMHGRLPSWPPQRGL